MKIIYNFEPNICIISLEKKEPKHEIIHKLCRVLYTRIKYGVKIKYAFVVLPLDLKTLKP